MALDLDVFKKMTKEEIKEYGESLPIGHIRNENGNILTYKDSHGYWYEYTRDKRGNILTYKNSSGFWGEYIRDKRGNMLTYKNSSGFWEEYIRDKNGHELTYKSSTGFWSEYTRDENGKALTFKNSDGDDVEYLFWGIEYFLGYDKNTKKYLAGCQTLSYGECEEFYEENRDKFDDSHNFIKAIREHHKKLNG